MAEFVALQEKITKPASSSNSEVSKGRNRRVLTTWCMDGVTIVTWMGMDVANNKIR